jgi:hypothetical protein
MSERVERAIVAFLDAVEQGPPLGPVCVKICYTGQYIAPDRFQNLPLEVDTARRIISDMWCPSELRDLVRRYLEEATALLRTG